MSATTTQQGGGLRNRRSADRRTGDAGGALAMAHTLMRVLDEIDHGLMLVDRLGRMTFANQLAQAELRGDGGLHLTAGRLFGRTPGDQAALLTALVDAQRGKRRMFTVGSGEVPAVSVAAIPIAAGEQLSLGRSGDSGSPPRGAGAVPGDQGPTYAGFDDGEPGVLLIFGKRQAVEGLTADFFARAHGLTGAETVVLKQLCAGRKPKEIAAVQTIAISTVRSHIASIRAKTQAGSIADLVNRVSVLPPLTPAMKTVAGSAAPALIDRDATPARRGIVPYVLEEAA